jgi:hypothetical protein
MPRLSARVLTGVVSANYFSHANQWDHNQLSDDELYVQLVSLDSNPSGTPPGIRYLPAAGSVLVVTLPSLDASKVQAITATQPFANDLSIFKVLVSSLMDFGSGNIVMTLTESAVVKRITIISGVRVVPNDPSTCGLS